MPKSCNTLVYKADDSKTKISFDTLVAKYILNV